MSMLFPEELELLLCGGAVSGSLHARPVTRPLAQIDQRMSLFCWVTFGR